MRALAAELADRSVVLTFDRHPATVVRPESAPPILTDEGQRLELLAATGIDAAVVLPFDTRQASEPPESFIERVLVTALRAKVIVVGRDFHFGHNRTGHVDMLEKFGRTHDFEVRPIDLVVRADGVDEPVSSTAIRRALAGGDVTRAAQMLGRPYEIRGTGRDGRPARPNARLPDRQHRRAPIDLPARRRGVRRVVRARRRVGAPVRDQPRPASDVLRARRRLAARGAPARFLRRPLRRACRGCASPTSCAASASSTGSRRSSPNSASTSATPATLLSTPS